MIKNEIARQITITANEIVRVVCNSDKLDFEVDTIYDNKNKAESWSYNAQIDFSAELWGKYRYVLYCKGVPVHEVDYDNKEEVEVLNAYCSEHEVLVPAETKMRITYVATDEDREEMGYYTIELELI